MILELHEKMNTCSNKLLYMMNKPRSYKNKRAIHVQVSWHTPEWFCLEKLLVECGWYGPEVWGTFLCSQNPAQSNSTHSKKQGTRFLKVMNDLGTSWKQVSCPPYICTCLPIKYTNTACEFTWKKWTLQSSHHQIAHEKTQKIHSYHLIQNKANFCSSEERKCSLR